MAANWLQLDVYRLMSDLFGGVRYHVPLTFGFTFGAFFRKVFKSFEFAKYPCPSLSPSSSGSALLSFRLR